MHVRPLDATSRPWLRTLMLDAWGLPVVSISGSHDPSTLPCVAAYEESAIVGVTTFRIVERECELVTLNSLIEGRGVGSALLAAVKEIADAHGARLWLITTDDNARAIRFYERRGMTRTVLHRDFVERVRAMKPDVTGDETSYRDAIEFSF